MNQIIFYVILYIHIFWYNHNQMDPSARLIMRHTVKTVAAGDVERYREPTA